MIKSGRSFLSQMFHYVFSCRTPRSKFDKGILIISVDIDVGCKEVDKKRRKKACATETNRQSQNR